MLLDFGLARTSDGENATLTESFAGSPAYASPEQISKSSAVDARTDVYSLGVTLYQRLSGRPPFEGDSVEALFHRILTAQVTPLRKLAPSIPRDLQTIVHQALEREPARRYATAAELADDLEAVLELRPIRGRPPGPVERARRVLRRHQVATAGAATALLFLAGFGTFWILRGLAQRRAVREEAAAAIVAARDKIAEYRQSRAALSDIQFRLQELRVEQASQYFTPEDYALLDENERKLDDSRRSWERTFYEVLDLLRQAERLDPEAEGCAEVRAELYLERYREAQQGQDADGAEFYADLARASDPGGKVAAELDSDVRLAILSEPAGAEVFLFRLEEESRSYPDGEQRLVAIPVSDERPPIRPGAWCLRVLEDSGELRRGDLVVEIAGRPIEGTVLVSRGGGPIQFLDRLVSADEKPIEDGWSLQAWVLDEEKGDAARSARAFVFERAGETFEIAAASWDELGASACTAAGFAADPDRPPAPCRLVRAGELLSARMPPGLEARTTARPLLASPSCSLGRTPLSGIGVSSGTYLALLVREGCEELRLPFVVGSGMSTLQVELLSEGSTPDRFVYVPPLGPVPKGFWFQEREVTCAEYLEFLKDPATLREIAACRGPIRAPRQGRRGDVRFYWEPREDGSFELPDDWGADWPVLGLSWDDASAYARWRTRRAEDRGEGLIYSLPTRDEFEVAALGGSKWPFVYGMRHRAKWSRSCYARPSAHPGPVLEFPVDESIFGAFDLTGGAFEWLAGWYDEERELRHLVGGAWGEAGHEVLKVTGGLGVPGDTCTGETGLRLVARRADGGER